MGARRQKVLIVDDEDGIVFALYRVLYQDNARYDVLLARSAEIARDIMIDAPVDVLVTDVHLPGRSGMDLLSWAAVRAPATRAIVMTAYDVTGIKDRALASGALRLVRKPFDANEVRETILRALDQRDSIAGNIGDLSIVDVVQMLCIARKTAALRISEGESAGVLMIDGGDIVHAIWDDLTGPPAFERILTVKHGVFTSAPLPSGFERTLQGDWQHVLIDGVRKLDEATIEPPPPREEPDPELATAVRFEPFSIPPGADRHGWDVAPASVPLRPLPPPPAFPSFGEPHDGRAEVARLIDAGFAALRAGKRDDARDSWEEALRLDPGNRLIELNLRKLEQKAIGQR